MMYLISTVVFFVILIIFLIKIKKSHKDNTSKEKNGTSNKSKQSDDKFEPSRSELIKLKVIKHSELPKKLDEILGNHYENINIISVGGMGVIAEAIQKKSKMKVAIKTVLPELEHEEKAVRLFFAECNAIKIMNHPNIVKIFEVGETDVLYYYIMEYLEGENLNQIISNCGPLELHDTLKYATHIARALQHCHDNKVIHRDIKPSNIFITSKHIAKIIDFGIVKLLTGDPSLIKNTTKVGTPDYASPEQLQGKPISGKSDIYSLGACIFNMLTDDTPYKATDLLGKMLEKPKNIHDLCDNCPEPLADIVYKCLEVEPRNRPTATQVWYALKAIHI